MPMKFRTAAGQQVEIVVNNQWLVDDAPAHRWVCRGCDRYQTCLSTKRSAEEEANQHAAGCRAVP